MNKITLLITALITSFSSFAQEINIGGSFGTGVGRETRGMLSCGMIIEYRPRKTILSFNTEPSVLFYSKQINGSAYREQVVGSVPVYLKLNIGHKLRFCPFAGGLITTTSAYGITAGFTIEYRIKDRIFMFVKNDFNHLYYKTIHPSYLDPPEAITESASLFWISFGTKVNVFGLRKQKNKAIRI